MGNFVQWMRPREDSYAFVSTTQWATTVRCVNHCTIRDPGGKAYMFLQTKIHLELQMNAKVSEQFHSCTMKITNVQSTLAQTAPTAQLLSVIIRNILRKYIYIFFRM